MKSVACPTAEVRNFQIGSSGESRPRSYRAASCGMQISPVGIVHFTTFERDDYVFEAFRAGAELTTRLGGAG